MSAVLNMWLVYCLWVAPIFVEVCKFGNGTMSKGVESVMWSVPLRGRAPSREKLVEGSGEGNVRTWVLGNRRHWSAS